MQSLIQALQEVFTQALIQARQQPLEHPFIVILTDLGLDPKELQDASDKAQKAYPSLDSLFGSSYSLLHTLSTASRHNALLS